MNDERRAPPRLLDSTGPAGDCLREVVAQEELLALPPRFALLRERRRRHVHRQRGLVSIGLAVTMLVGFRSLQQEEPRPDISPELVSTLSRHAQARPSSMSKTNTSAGRREADVVKET